MTDDTSRGGQGERSFLLCGLCGVPEPDHRSGCLLAPIAVDDDTPCPACGYGGGAHLVTCPHLAIQQGRARLYVDAQGRPRITARFETRGERRSRWTLLGLGWALLAAGIYVAPWSARAAFWDFVAGTVLFVASFAIASVSLGRLLAAIRRPR